MSEPRARKLVVAGLIVGDDQRVLITQRRADQALPLQWEFPGGKVEPGEAPVGGAGPRAAPRSSASRSRSVGSGTCCSTLYPTFDLVMLVYALPARTRLAGPRAVEVADLTWVETVRSCRARGTSCPPIDRWSTVSSPRDPPSM